MRAGRLRQIYVCLFVYLVLGGGLGVKVILLESVFKSWVDTHCWPSSNGQAERDYCGDVEILSHKLCKRYMDMDIHTIPLSLSLAIFSLPLSHSYMRRVCRT